MVSAILFSSLLICLILAIVCFIKIEISLQKKDVHKESKDEKDNQVDLIENKRNDDFVRHLVPCRKSVQSFKWYVLEKKENEEPKWLSFEKRAYFKRKRNNLSNRDIDETYFTKENIEAFYTFMKLMEKKTKANKEKQEQEKEKTDNKLVAYREESLEY